MARRALLLRLLLLLALASALPGRAQTGPDRGAASDQPAGRGARDTLPAADALRAERARIETERKPIFDPANPATAARPNAFPDIETPARADIDLEALAQRYARRAAGRNGESLLVFVSFSMPKASLRRAIHDANRVGGAVVARGFLHGSIKDTAMALRELDASDGQIQIHPDAFAKYGIDAVPALVLARPDGQDGPAAPDGAGCALAGAYIKVGGDVSLAYALDHIERNAPAFRDMAARYARQLAGDPR